ncbi:baseplate assembly protein [Stenotrophomonas maltophilia]|uniref:baseplate assembly protein n=1 Tax=Stenotrophomonas maltophilia TaxID=40324 RepID=UPI0015DF9C04|nr:baseplate assembly protein [Stenotrophomonas maltophilia]
MSSFTAIEVDKLPAPDIFRQRTFEEIYAARLAEFRRLCPEYTALVESDPVIKLLQAGAYREMVKDEEFNQRARGLLLPYSKGADLDNLAVPFGVQRKLLTPADPKANTAAVYENDAAFRRRIQLAPESLSVAGPEGAYIFHTLSAHSDVLDASVASPSPGKVVVTVLSRQGNGTPSADLLKIVEAALLNDNVRPLTDYVTVAPASVKPFEIRARLVTFNGPDSALVLAEARRRVDLFLQQTQRLGRDVPLSALYSALHVDGVHRVQLMAPTADMPVDAQSAPFCTSVVIEHGGTDA